MFVITPWSARLSRSLHAACGLLVALLVAGCGTLPRDVTRTPSAALEPSEASALVRIARASTPAPDESGFRLMPVGIYSLDARIALAKRAERSLDVQYYVIENDATGRLLLRSLRDAALRGVRVRLLVDDLYTTHTDDLLRQLAAYPNVEVRLFNPFCCARGSGHAGRYAASLFDFFRLNGRMHNKLFIADGAMAVAGGRNIADEYFQRHTAQNFIDMDAFIVGAVVSELATIFDRYWNSVVVYPVEAINRTPLDRAQLQATFAHTIDTLPQAPPIEPGRVDILGYGPITEDLDAGQVGLVWGTARAYADPPEKFLHETDDDAIEVSVTRDVMKQIWQAKDELIITSPYLIPGKRGLQGFQNLRDRDVKVTVVTNSLAATDEPLVHTGYSRYRYDMLLAGVDIYELSAVRTKKSKRLGFGSSLGRLHSKTAIIDMKTVFIGSMNLDPRSESQNTELGIFVQSRELAKELARVINVGTHESAYRLRLQPDGPGIQWLATDDDKEVILGVEPESSALLRLHNIFFGLFVPEQLL